MAASNHVGQCYIWPNSPSTGYPRGNGSHYIDVDYSPRAGGQYSISFQARSMLYMGDVDDKARARLTTLLIDLRAEENISPIVTQQLIRQAQNAAGLSDKARMDRLLRHYVKRSEHLGATVSVGGESELHSVNWSLDRSPTACEALAWSESLEWAEVQTLTRALSQYGLIELDETGDSPIGVVATVAGRERVASVSQEKPATPRPIGFKP